MPTRRRAGARVAVLVVALVISACVVRELLELDRALWRNEEEWWMR